MASNVFMPIAVCGYSCKLPGSAVDAESLWKMCEEGRDAWSKIPHKRFSQKAFYSATKGEPGTTNVAGGYFLAEDAYAFDASFFNASVETAMSMDPIVRLQLESVFEAFEHAGLTLDEVAGSRSSVFSGAFHRDYHDSLSRNPDELPRFLLTGTGTAMLSNRISHFFDLRGPSMTLDTGCSSSLTSLHTACRSLQANDCDMSIVTGCNLMLNPDPFISMSNLGLLSTSGRSYAFDERAEGYGRGEGVVTLILKTLAQAKIDGDTVYAIIRGSASNQDGKTTTITSPSQQAQETVIRDCYAVAGLDPCQTPFVECHGTGTKVGDLCETSAIRNSFQTDSRDIPLYLGSVKSNIGHLEAASGLASIIKVIKAFQHNKIPPNYDFVNPNPSIAWDDWKLAVARNALPWPSDLPKRASVNSFGYGGSNAHVVLDAPEPVMLRANGRTKEDCQNRNSVFLLSSNDEQSCVLSISKFRTYIENLCFEKQESEAEMLTTISHKLALKRTHFKWRTAVQASSTAELVNELASKEAKPVRSISQPSIGFVFTGQGANWAGMGKELIDSYAVFHDALKDLDACLADLGASWSIIDELRRGSSTSRIEQAEFSMPICCALQIALVVLLRSWNIFPSAVSGHSSGESAAAFAVGALDMRSALAVQYYRGLLTAESGSKMGVKGGMLAVGLDPEEAQRHVDKTTSGKVVIGCFNSPSSVTLSGDEAGILELEQSMRDSGIFVRKLQVQTAFHSHHMESDALKYRQLLESSLSTTSRRLTAPLASSVTGTWLTESRDFGPEHWVKYMLDPVQFTRASTKLCTEKVADESHVTGQRAVDIIIEIGPHSALSSPLRQTMQSLKIVDIAYTSVLKRSESALTSAHKLAGFLWCRGYPIDLKRIIQMPRNDEISTIDLPSYAWNHTAHFEIHHPSEEAFRQRLHPKNPLIGTIQPSSNPAGPSWKRECVINGQSWPYELTIDSMIISPQSLFLSMAIEAGQQLVAGLEDAGQHRHPLATSLDNIDFNSAVNFSSAPTTMELRTSLYELQQSVGEKSRIIRAFQIHCVQHPNQWTLLCQGQVTMFMNSLDLPLQKTMLFANKVEPSRIALRQGVLGDNSNVDDKFTQTSSAHLESSSQSTGMFFQGQWSGLSSPALDETSLGLQKLGSVFQAAMAFNSMHPAGIANHIPSSIEQVIVGPKTSSEFSPFYKSNARMDQDGALLVTWSQVTKADGTNECATQNIDIRGIKFAAPSVPCKIRPALSEKSNKVHILSMRHSLLNASNEEMDEIPRHYLGDEERKILLDLNMLCKIYFHQTLTALRKDPPRRLLGHFSSYVQLMKSIESVSSSELQRWSDDDIAALRARVLSSSVNGLLVCTVGDQLVPLIRGEMDPLEVMMKDRLLHRYYEEGLRWTRSYQQLQALLKTLSFEQPRMEILEIGAGTGGATLSVLEALAAGEQSSEDIRCESYTYTDISAGFLSKAKEKFSRYGHVMDFKKLDIEKDLKTQSFEGRTYDLIVASQCLHATSDMRRTMANVRKLLKPNGRLVMIETTQDSLDIQLFTSCFRGWWLSVEPERKWSPSLTIDLWQQILIETGFSGIDFTVRDCEDEELYAMQVILSTAVLEPDKTATPSSELRLIISDESQSPSITHTLREHVGRICEIKATTIQDLDCGMNDSPYLMAIGNKWASSDVKLDDIVGQCKGALLVSTERFLGKTSRESGKSLGSPHPNKPIVSLLVESEVDMWDQSTSLAISNVFKASVYGESTRQHDREYVLTRNKLYTPRVATFAPLVGSRASKCPGMSETLKPNEYYIISGSSASLIIAACRLSASLGARNIVTVLTGQNDRIESELCVMQTFADALLVETNCQVTLILAGANPKINGRIAGIIDFGDVEGDTDLRNASQRCDRSTTSTLFGSAIMDASLDFHIKFTPLYSLLSLSEPSEFMGTTLYTGSIATTDEFARNVQEGGSQPVEMHTVLLLLADLVTQPGPVSKQTLYIGLPASLCPEERDQVCVDPQFRGLSLPTRMTENTSKVGGQSASLQILPTMSKQEKVDVICGGIVGYIADMFMLSASEIDENEPLTQYIDSLTAVQLRTWLLSTFRAGLTVDDISKSQSIRFLAEKATTLMTPPK